MRLNIRAEELLSQWRTCEGSKRPQLFGYDVECHLVQGELVLKSRFAFLLLIALSRLPVSAQTQPQPGTLRGLLLHELRTTHNKTEWFVPINTAVEGLTAEQANWQPSKGGHSAGQLAYHLLFWNRRNLNNFQGVKSDKFTGDNKETFDRFDNKQWTGIVNQLDQVMTGLEKFVETADDQQLAKWANTIGNLCAHNAYHIGQIVYVRKLQGTWNPDKGVKS